MAKFVVVSTKQLLDLVKRFNRGAFGRSGRDVAISKVLNVFPEKLRTAAKNYQETTGQPVPKGKSVVAKDFFEALNTSVSSKRLREKSMPRTKGTTPRWPETHIRRDLETGEWITSDHTDQDMGRHRSAKAAKGEVRQLGDWLNFSRDPRAVVERGSRYDPNNTDPLTQLINKALGVGKTGNN